MKTDDCGPPGTLLASTLALLSANPEYSTHAAATGLGKNWIYKLAKGRIADPSVNKVQRLYEHLAGLPLKLEEHNG
jgi:hypothetical protein